MKTYILPVMAIALCAILLTDCNSGNREKKGDSPTPKPVTPLPQRIANESSQMSIQDANIMVNRLSMQLDTNARYSGNVPLLENNIWQYIFPTTRLVIKPGDRWNIRKAYDTTADPHKVCFVLEVVNSSKPMTTRYYKGIADCPRICGYLNGGLSVADRDNYQVGHELINISMQDAENLLKYPQPNCAQIISINWDQGISYCLKHASQFIQVIYGISETDMTADSALLFNVDEKGNAMGLPWTIPPSQICIYHVSGECPL